MLVTAGYWAYLSNESKTLETVNLGNQDTTNNVDENLGKNLNFMNCKSSNSFNCTYD